MEKENKDLEYKQTINKRYLKTVSAFANFGDGEIIFGITDDYKVVGIENPVDACLDIENQINDTIKPKPNYSLRINGDKTISLLVKQGDNTPYRYNGVAYKRNDSSTIEVDPLDEKRLILSGMNISFEEITSNCFDCTFDFLGGKIKEAAELSVFNLDILKSLTLFNPKKGYNNAGKLLADTNDFPGLDIAVFGDSINIIKKRIDLSGKSIVKQYYDSLDIFKNEYVLERIEEGFRKKVELVPMEAYREAVANALVHRTWDVKINTKIEMFPDKIVIASPGGLLSGMSEDDYVNGNFSYLRNPIIANTFRKLNIIEAFATGIKRINKSYVGAPVKPIYKVGNDAISITSPTIVQPDLSLFEKRVLNSMKEKYIYTRPEIERLSGIGKDSLIRILNSLIKRGIIKKEGKGKATLYQIVTRLEY